MAKKVGERLHRDKKDVKRAKVVCALPSKKKNAYVFRERMVFLDQVKEALAETEK